MLEPQDKVRIHTLLAQISAIYKEATNRSSDMVCDICGEGDKQAKHALLKVKTGVHGYEHRPHVSPHLCHRHGGGWALSYNAFNPVRTRTDEEIDLHFALYLATQLTKQSMKEKQNA